MKSSESVIVTVMLLQRQVPVSWEEKVEGSWEFGSPVGGLGILVEGGVVLMDADHLWPDRKGSRKVVSYETMVLI